MYGMVNKSLQDMVSTTYGASTWDSILAKANVEEEVFISNEAYPDAITYNLVTAASEILNRPATDLLEDFGVHWVTKTAKHGYGPLLRANGATLPEFLQNLPNFHTRVSLMFPDLRPPMFRCSDATSDSLHLHYYSDRPGLCPFVVGLVRGLGVMFDTSVEVTQVQTRNDGFDHDVFHIRWQRDRVA